MDFQNIHLSRSEINALKQLDIEPRYAKDINKEGAMRLLHLEFIVKKRFNAPEKGNHTFYEINHLGHDYLMYHKGIKSRRRVEIIAYWITTTIAIAALVRSFL